MQSLIIFAACLCLASASFLPYAHAPAPIQLSPDGKHVLDTPEVAHAKAAHLAAHAQASTAHGAWAPAHGYASAPAAYAVGHYGAPGAGLHKYGPAPLAHDGRVIDTPEVAHLKAAHLAAHSAAAHGGYGHGGYGHGGYGHDGYAHGGPGLGAIGHGHAAPLAYAGGYGGGYGGGKWHGPQAHIQLTHDGQYVVDTPEVQHARAAHFAQFHHAAAAAAAAPEEPWDHGHGHHGGWH